MVTAVTGIVVNPPLSLNQQKTAAMSLKNIAKLIAVCLICLLLIWGLVELIQLIKT